MQEGLHILSPQAAPGCLPSMPRYLALDGTSEWAAYVAEQLGSGQWAACQVIDQGRLAGHVIMRKTDQAELHVIAIESMPGQAATQLMSLVNRYLDQAARHFGCGAIICETQIGAMARQLECFGFEPFEVRYRRGLSQ